MGHLLATVPDKMGYSGADLPTALARVSAAWLIAMPVAACNLILLTAAEDGVFVGESGFGNVLPLAARGCDH